MTERDYSILSGFFPRPPAKSVVPDVQTKVIRVSGILTAVNEETGYLGTRKIRPFTMPADSAWVDVTDTAFERTFNEHGHWVAEDDSGLIEE